MGGPCARMKAALLLGVAALAVLAMASGRDDGSMYVMETQHYRVRTDVSQDFAGLVGRHMEAIHKEYSRRLKEFELKVGDKFEVRVYARRVDYDAAVPGELLGSGGAFVSKDRLLAACMEGRTDEQVFRTLYHEGLHQFLYSSFAQECPVWVNEGLAEYFSEATWNGRTFSTGQVPAGRLYVVQSALRANQYVPLENLFKMKSEEWLDNVRSTETRASLQYCEAWSVVHFLIHARGGRYGPRLLDYLRNISEGVDRALAFDKSFGSNVASLERAWSAYVMQLRPGPDQVCRRNLELLAFMALHIYATPQRFRSLEELHGDLTRENVRWHVVTPYGEEITSANREAVELLFRCPYDRRPSRASYILLKDAETGLPTLFCNHHQGIVAMAYYVPGGEGGYTVEVEQVVRDTLPLQLVRTLDSLSPR